MLSFRTCRKMAISSAFVALIAAQPVEAQIFNPSDAAIVAKLGDILRTHRENLVQAIRSARGIESTFRTLRNLDDYEKSLRRDIGFISRLDVSRLDDLERLVLYGDRADFYFRSLTGTINRSMYNLAEQRQYGERFLQAMDGLGVVDPKILQALLNDEKSLSELGITPQEAAALVKELGVESTMMDLYQVRGTENLIAALTEQSRRLKEVAKDSSVKLDQGQRVMLLTKSEESLIEALKYQQDLGDRLQNRNKKVKRTLMLKSELEADIAQLESFYKWRTSLERNLGFFDTDYVKRQDY